MAPMDSISYAQEMRDVIKNFITKEIVRLRPTAAFGRVTAIASDRKSCSVVFPGDTDPVPVRMYSTQPATAGAPGVGDVVRVEGISGDRYVTEVVAGLPFIQARQASFLGIPTSGGSANAVIDAVTGLLTRSTSSRRYKKNIMNHQADVEKFMKLHAVTFESNDSTDSNRYLGLIAEEVAEIGDSQLDLLVVRDADGNPEAINYDRVPIILLPVVQKLVDAVDELQDIVEALESRIEQLENA